MKAALLLFAVGLFSNSYAQLNRWEGSEIGQIQHKPNGEATSIYFVNASSEPVDVFWLKPSGEESKVTTLPPGGKKITVNTYTNHFLVLRNARGNFVRIYQNTGTLPIRTRVGNLGGVELLQCDKRPDKSPQNGAATEIEFINKRPDVMNIFWVNFEGAEILYKSLEPGQSYRQSTFCNHYWVVRDYNYECLGICYNPEILRAGATFMKFDSPEPQKPEPTSTSTPTPTPKPVSNPAPKPESNILSKVGFESDTYFRIVNKTTGTSRGVSVEREVPVMQMINTYKGAGLTTEENTSQYWRFQYLGNGNRYKIYNDLFTSPTYLTASSSGNVRMELANTEAYQKGEQEWIIERQEDGYYSISSVLLKNEAYRYLFCDAGNNSLFFSKWEPPKTRNGNWYFSPLGRKFALTPTPEFGLDAGYLKSSSGQNLYPVYGWNDFSGSVLQALVVKNSGNDKVVFEFTPQPDGTFGISFKADGKHYYLDGHGITSYDPNSGNSNDNFLTSKYNRWRSVKENGMWRFVNAENGKSLVLQSVTAGSSTGRGGSSSGKRYTGLRVTSSYSSGEQLFLVSK